MKKPLKNKKKKNHCTEKIFIKSEKLKMGSKKEYTLKSYGRNVYFRTKQLIFSFIFFIFNLEVTN